MLGLGLCDVLSLDTSRPFTVWLRFAHPKKHGLHSSPGHTLGPEIADVVTKKYLARAELSQQKAVM